jgi:thiol-disulfide isomerase/thioredoxin
MNTRLSAALILFLSINGYLFPQENCFEHCWENLAAANRTFAKDEEFSFPYQRVMTYLEGCPMPPFSYKTIENEQVSQEKLPGKVVVMNFWFQSCTPCLNELPGLNKLAETYKDSDVVFLAFGRDSEASIRRDCLKKCVKVS